MRIILNIQLTIDVGDDLKVGESMNLFRNWLINNHDSTLEVFDPTHEADKMGEFIICADERIEVKALHAFLKS